MIRLVSSELQEVLIIQLVPVFLTKLGNRELGEMYKGHCEETQLFSASFAGISISETSLETKFMTEGVWLGLINVGT